MLVRIRDTEGCAPEVNHIWDSVWVQRLDASGGYADWLLAGADDPAEQGGGLRARAALHTATLICLFTDRRLPADLAHPNEDGDPRGWWGDSVRLDGEPDTAIGSLLWTLERAVLNERTAFQAGIYAAEALDVLVEQGAVARTEVETEIRIEQGLLGIQVRHFDRSGGIVYAQAFDVLWREAAGNAPMNFGDQGVFV